MQHRISLNVATVGVFAVVAIVMLVFGAGRLEAIPAFASRHKMNCSTCHSNEWPRLNRVGYEYKLRGYRFAFEKADKIASPTDVVSVEAKFARTSTRSAHKSWAGETAYKDVNVFGAYNFGPKDSIAIFSEVDLVEGAIQREARWFKAGNATFTFGNEKNTYQTRVGRFPQFRGSMFMGADRLALSRPFILADTVQGHQFAKNYGLGGEFLYTRNMKTTFRAFAMRLDETGGYRDSATSGVAAQRLFGNGDSSASITYVHSSQPRIAGGEATISRVYATGSWDAHPKLLFLGGIAGGSSRAWNGIRRSDIGFYGEVDTRLHSNVSLTTRYDELGTDLATYLPKRGVSQGAIVNLYSRNNFNLRAFADYGKTFNTGPKNKQVVDFGVNVTF